MTTFENTPRRLTRAEASIYLKERHGVSRTHGTLSKLAVIGGGPAFRKIGVRTVVYDTADLDAWVKTMLSPPVTSTSELHAA